MENHTIRETVNNLIVQTSTLLRDLEAFRHDLDGDAIQVPRQGRWTRPMLAQTWERVHDLPGVRALFEITASRPGQVVTFTELIAHSGLAVKQQGNEHARLSRVTNEMFGEKRWPIENWQGSPGPNGAEMKYRMPATIAEWFRDLTRRRAAASRRPPAEPPTGSPVAVLRSARGAPLALTGNGRAQGRGS